ncbi:MAG TPA: hypothetical protein DD438_13100 [Verrucomicrobiales bacterium]|nr:hypothetical protein [Verrucomicrobiales bacterium]|tara:strand:+ start:461 stop:1279 length:819 start_codon:yes stop_codon:yes gene_type:complete
MTRITALTTLQMILLGGMLLHAESRSWRSANGNQSFRAEFISSDGSSVLLRKPNRKTVTVALNNLHSSDRDWVRQYLKRNQARAEARITGDCFDTLTYGDGRAVVETKLRGSPVVSKTLDGELVGRTGLNGIYHTSVAGEEYRLFFEWSDDNELREVTLRGKSAASVEYAKGLRQQWQGLVSSLRSSHGSPVQATGYPPPEELTGGKLLGSHLWHTENGHSILLCTGQEKGEYLVAVRFAANKIPPNVLLEVPAEKTEEASRGRKQSAPAGL